ncbi:MAG: hypothetical protein JWN62_4641 [Acidimicrobiales bacterium]|nr:hypothetical protein [Acidimicrobiales bacterium]
MTDKKAKVAVLGIGYSKISRGNSTQSLGADAVEACRAAISDAGIGVEEVDGITTYKYRPDYYGGSTAAPDESVDGVLVASPQYIWKHLGFPNLRWGEWNDKFVGSSLIEAHNAIAGGACRYALVWRACGFEQGIRYGNIDPDRVTGNDEFTLPYGAYGGPPLLALLAQRYFDGYGATRAHMATFISMTRKNALLSGRGYWAENRPEQLSVADYMAARMISSPLCLYDCDIPVQGCAAYLLGPAEAAQDVPHGSAFIKGFAQGYLGPGGVQTFLHSGGRARPPLDDGYAWEPNLELGRRIASNLWAATGLTPKDISTANLYDGFSIIAWSWLEGLGFCGEGEAFEFVQDGRVEIGGELPINTSGGNLGEGRMHGAPHVSEAIYQAMGRAGERQVKDARYTLAAPDRLAVGQAIVFSSEPD